MATRVRALRFSSVLAILSLALPGQLDAQQLFQGPAQGTSDLGTQQSTDAFPAAPAPGLLRPAFAPPEMEFPSIPAPPGILPPLAPAGANEQEDLAAWFRGLESAAAPGLLRSFIGLPDDSRAIPPDPITAAGPNHLMALVNRRFAIFNKSGTKLKEIDGPNWYNVVLAGNGSFDPKVIYDHFAGRWVMVWLSIDRPPPNTTTSHLLVSVSDDSDPNGLWCNWALRGDVNGNTPVSNWSDYQGLGFDEFAVYVVPNQFTFAGGYDYVKIRILPKADLYDPACPAITYNDFWDLRDPGNLGQVVFTTRPAVTFGSPGVQYLVGNSVFIPHNYMTLWSLTNPLDPSPGLTAVNVPVTAATPPPDADQQGGSTIAIDVGGSRLRNAVYRNGSLWTAHSVSAAGGLYARARYVKIEVSTPSVLEDVSFGSDGCWLYYPAITADSNDNMVVVYNQSCTDTYIGIRYTGRTPSDVALQPSAQLKAGEANYVKDFSSGKNRWGDYNGIAVDPVAPRRVWMFAEYAASPANTWGTWFGEVAPRRLGDVNNDGSVDVADIVLIVDFILERSTPDPLEEFSANCNQDAAINVGDLVCVVNLILGGAGPAFAAAPSGGALGSVIATARLSEGEASGAPRSRTVVVEADLEAGAAAMQAVIAYDAQRLRVGTPRLAEGALGFQLATHDRGGEVAVVLYDLRGDLLPSGKATLLYLPVETLPGSGESGLESLELRELFFADRAGAVRAAEIGKTSLTPLPARFHLSNPYPNPVSTTGTKLDLDVPEAIGPALSGAGAVSGGAVRVLVEVFNVRGQKIRTVMNTDLLPGRHTIEWDGRTDRGGVVGAGLYVLRLRAGTFNATRKLIVR